MKKVAILLTSEPETGGEHQYLLFLMESLKKCDGKYFEVLAICYNRFWCNWCKKNKVNYVKDKLKYYSIEERKINAKYPWISKIYNTFRTPIGKIVIENRVDLLICGQQGKYIPSLFCKNIRPAHDLMHRYETE